MAIGYGPQVFELHSDGTYERIDWTDTDKVSGPGARNIGPATRAERGYVEMEVRLTNWFAPGSN